MDDTLHYLIMANQMLVQKLSRIDFIKKYIKEALDLQQDSLPV